MKLIKSILSLTTIKAIDYLVPLLIIPYSINVLGVGVYGKVAFFQTIAIFLGIIIDFGFNVVGLQRLSIRTREKNKKRYITASIIIKIMLGIVCIPLFYMLSIVSPIYSQAQMYVIHFSCLIMLSSIFNNQWIYQAEHRYRFIMFTSLFSRVFCFILILLFVRNDNDVFNYALLIMVMFALPAIIQTVDLSKSIEPLKISMRYLKIVFLTNINIFYYRVVSASILPIYNYSFGGLLSPAEFGVFSFLQRILGAVVNFSTPINQALIPYLAKAKKEPASYFILLKKCTVYLLLYSLVVMLCAFFGTWLIIDMKLIDGGITLEKVLLPACIYLTIIPHIMNGFLSQTLTLHNRSYDVRKIVIFIAVLSLSFCYITFQLEIKYMLLSYVSSCFIMFFLLLNKILKK